MAASRQLIRDMTSLNKTIVTLFLVLSLCGQVKLCRAPPDPPTSCEETKISVEEEFNSEGRMLPIGDHHKIEIDLLINASTQVYSIVASETLGTCGDFDYALSMTDEV